MTCSGRWNREIFTNIQIHAILGLLPTEGGGMGWGRRRGEQKKKKFLFSTYACFSAVKCVRLCTYLYGLVHFSYLLLCISLWLRVSIYYDTMRRYTSIPLLLLSHHVKSVVLGSTQSSLLISAISSSLWAPSSPLPQISSLSPTSQLYSGQHVSAQIYLPFHRQHLPTPPLCFSTTLPLPFCLITCS